MKSKNGCKHQRNISENGKFKLNQEQNSFLNIITKYFILNTIAIISSQFVQLIAMIAEFIYISSKNENVYHLLEDIFWCLWICWCCN